MTRAQQQAYKDQYQTKLNADRTPRERARHAAGEYIIQRGTISVAEMSQKHQVTSDAVYQMIALLK